MAEITTTKTSTELKIKQGSKVITTIPLTIDIFDATELFESFEAMGEEEDMTRALPKLLKALPADVRDALRGVDIAVSIHAIKAYAESLGERLGEAFA